jgi:hypothetical protein
MARLTKRKYLAAGVAVAVVASGGVAFAYWTSGGSGTGTATTGDSTAFVVTVDDSPSNLTPGGPVETVGFTVDNPSTGHQNVSGAAASVTGTDKPGCDATDFAITATTVTTGDLGPGGTTTGSFKIQMVNKAVSQDACKNATVNLKVDVS